MGLLDQILGAAGGGQNAAVLQSVIGMLTGGQGGQGGGLQGIVNALNNKGLGDVVNSWVGTGANLPVSAQQIQQALGPQLQQIAAQHGIDLGTVAQQVAQHLPGIVDKLTPGGKIPDAAALQNLLKGIAK
jgi:uncharacterized protein YidB (DUF937 family)